MTKIANTVLLSVFLAILVITGITFSVTLRDPLGNGAGILWKSEDTFKTLRTKTGVCYDISCLFAAICRSQGIPCCVVNGYARTNRSIQHTWNRVCIDGAWYNVDVTHGINNINFYGFHPVDDYNSADENFVIVRIY